MGSGFCVFIQLFLVSPLINLLHSHWPLCCSLSIFFPFKTFVFIVPSAWSTALPQYLHVLFFQSVYIYAQISPPQRGLPWSSFLKECFFSLSSLLPGIIQHIHLYSCLLLISPHWNISSRALIFLYLTLSGAPITMPGHGRHHNKYL